MPNEFNIYCDESCHLEHDSIPIMVLGAIWCPKRSSRKISKDLRNIKDKYSARGELKWKKASKSHEEFYLELVKYFFENPDLHFRCLIVDDKTKLNHDYFNKGEHNAFYYKMYYSMLKAVLSPDNVYNIYIDIKDTRSSQHIKNLKDILCNNVYDFTKEMIAVIQHIRSHESELMQLTDLLIGAVAYKNRRLSGNLAKKAIVDEIERKTRFNLCASTSLFEEKFNIFVFHPRIVE